MKGLSLVVSTTTELVHCKFVFLYAAANNSGPPPSSIKPADSLTLSLQAANLWPIPPIWCRSSTRGCTQLTLMTRDT